MDIRKFSEHVNTLFLYLSNHKQEAAQQLFPGADRSYLAEWEARSPVQFWHHLDWHNRDRLIVFAHAYYEEDLPGAS